MSRIISLLTLALVFAACKGEEPAGPFDGPQFSETIDPAGMVAYWKFDEGGGAIAYDFVNNNHGTIHGATWTDGKCAGALAFDGNDDYVDVPRVIQDDFTIEFWIQTTQVGRTGTYGAFSGTGLVDGEVGGYKKDYIVSLYGNVIAFGTGAPDHSIYSTSAANDGAWHHVAATRTKTTGLMRLYLDGQLEASANGGIQSLTDPQSLNVGRLMHLQHYFDGILDEVATYDRALPAEEVVQRYEYAATCGIISVTIDIKPGSDPNCFNNDGHGVIPVAILGAADFDVTQIDPATVQLDGLSVGARGKSNKLLAHVEDINSDGFDDLVVQIEDVDGAFTSGDGVAILTGQLFGGTAIAGTDEICVVP